MKMISSGRMRPRSVARTTAARLVCGGRFFAAEMLEQGFIRVGRDFPSFLRENRQERACVGAQNQNRQPSPISRFIFDPSVTLEDLERRDDFTCNAGVRS